MVLASAQKEERFSIFSLPALGGNKKKKKSASNNLRGGKLDPEGDWRRAS